MIVWFLDPMNFFPFLSFLFRLSCSIALFDFRPLFMFNIFSYDSVIVCFCLSSLSSCLFISLIFRDYYLLFVKWDFDASWWIRNKLFLLVMYLGHLAFLLSCPIPISVLDMNPIWIMQAWKAMAFPNIDKYDTAGCMVTNVTKLGLKSF